jgi:5-formyltetrahydrofolate cyclo-ligase
MSALVGHLRHLAAVAAASNQLDLRDWMRSAAARGLRIALPVVVEKGQPLIFREWVPGAPLTRGVWNIPIPADGAEVTPNVLIAVCGIRSAALPIGIRRLFDQGPH